VTRSDRPGSAARAAGNRRRICVKSGRALRPASSTPLVRRIPVEHRCEDKATLWKHHGAAQFAGIAWFNVQVIAALGVKLNAIANLTRQFLGPRARGEHHGGEIADSKFTVQPHAALDGLHAAHALLCNPATHPLELCSVQLNQSMGKATKALSGSYSPLT